MNILILSRGIPSANDPQNGSFEFDQAKALKKLGHNVIIAAVDSRLRFKKRNWGLSLFNKEDIHCYNYFLCPGAISGLLGIKFKNRLKARQWQTIEKKIIQNEEHIDVIYAHYLFNTYFAVNAFKYLKAPIVAIEHWSALNQEPMPYEVDRMAQLTYPHLSKILAVSEPLKMRIQQKFNVNPIVVHNMVGKDFIYHPTSQKKLFSYICVGSLFPIKNHALLVAALAKLSIPKDKWELNIIGEGKERKNLQNQIDACGLTKNIHLVGSKNKVEIAQMLNDSDAFVLPSRSENFSVAVLEALACGLPVVASICGGIRECINEKNGLLFEVDDVEGLALHLKYMFEHHKDYDRQAIADDCKARFSSEVIARQLTEIFEEVVQKR